MAVGMCTNDCPGQPIGTYEVPLALSPIASGETLLNYRYDKATDELVISKLRARSQRLFPHL